MTQAEAILRLLKRRPKQGATNFELVQEPTKYGLPAAFRYGARLHDLKKRGIEYREDGGRYWLKDAA